MDSVKAKKSSSHSLRRRTTNKWALRSDWLRDTWLPRFEDPLDHLVGCPCHRRFDRQIPPAADNEAMSPSAAPTESFDVIVVGGGHAGCEAAITAARLGLNTALFTLNLDRIAWQPCNPAVGGPAKSQLVHEVDALGGVIGLLHPA